MRGRNFLIRDFSRGVVDSPDYYGLANRENTLRDMLNVRSTPSGEIYKRNGFASHSPDSSYTEDQTQIFSYENPTGSDFLITLGGTTAYTTGISASPSASSIKGAITMTNGYPWAAVQAPASGGQGPFWMVNTQDTPAQWTGTGNLAAWSASGATAVPKGKYMVYFDNRVFIAGVPGTNGSKLYWSAIGDPRLWDTPDGGYTTFDPDDGEPITGLGTVGPYLLVFKATKTYVVFNTDTGGYRRISNAIGCTSPDTIVETDVGTIFLSSDKTFAVTDGSSIETVGNNYTDWVISNMYSDDINDCNAVYFDNKYIVSMESVGPMYTNAYTIPLRALNTKNILLVYDLKMGAWFVDTACSGASGINGSAIYDFAIIGSRNTDQYQTLFCLGAGSSPGGIFIAYQDGIYQDGGNSYDSFFVSPWHTFGDPNIRKTLRSIRYNSTSSSTNSKIFMATDFGYNYTALTVQDFDTTPEAVYEHLVYTPGTNRTFSFCFGDNRQNAAWTFYSYSLSAELRTD